MKKCGENGLACTPAEKRHMLIPSENEYCQ